MKFAPARRRNPFDNALLAWLVHVLTACGACISVYYALIAGTLVPLYIGGAAISMLEALWLYFRLRR